jgi:hypothetical protein
MTQFSDIAYISHGYFLGLVLLWSLYHIGSVERFRVFRLRTLKNLPSKSVATLILFLSLVAGLVFDVITAVLKYSYGLVRLPNLPTAWYIMRPLDSWTDNQFKYLFFLNFLQFISWMLKTAGMGIAVGVWHHATRIEQPKKQQDKDEKDNQAKDGSQKADTAGKELESESESRPEVKIKGEQKPVKPLTSFKNSWISGVIGGLAFLFLIQIVILQLVLTDSTILLITVPQLCFQLCVLLLILLTLCTVARMRKAIATCPPFTSATLINRVDYTSRQFIGLSYALFFEFISVLLIGIDAVGDSFMGIFDSKLALDLLTSLFIIGYGLSYIFTFLALFPVKTFNYQQTFWTAIED